MNTRFSNTNLIEMDCEGKWSNLSNDLWRKISKFIDTRTDLVRVRAVCKSSQSSVSPPVISLKVPLPSLDESLYPLLSLKPKSEYLPLVKRTIYKIQACEQNPNPWTLFGMSAPSNSISNGAFLFQVEEEEGAQGMRLLTPLCGNQIQPPLDPKGLNFLSSGLSEICTYYYYKNTTRFLDRCRLRKVVVSCSNPSDYAVLAMDYGYGMFEDVNGVLYFYKSGEHSWSWIDVTPESNFFLSNVVEVNGDSFTDIISYKGKFYVLECRGTTIVIDPSSKIVSHIAPYISPYCYPYSSKQMHLVESLGHLLLVSRDSSHDDNAQEIYVDNFNVYKLDEEEGKWVEIKSLGDQALFVSNSMSFSVSARDYVPYKENCIYYYSDEECHPYWDSRDILVMFSLEDGCSKPLQQGDLFF